MRAIDPAIVKGKLPPPAAGPAPMLEWVRIDRLVIDDTYQRPISKSGATNARRIAEAFRWSHFAPAIVAPIEGGMFAVIDGQHRVTAAAACGFDAVPCQIIIADRSEQARAFRAVNGFVTKMSRMAIHAAAVAGGDPAALILDEACRTAGVMLLRYPVQASEQKPGQTHAVQACAMCLERYGRDTLITALQCVTETENNQPGMLTGPLIKALCEVLAGTPRWRDAGEALLRAFDDYDLTEAIDVAERIATGSPRVPRQAALVRVLHLHLSQTLPAQPAAVSA